MCHSTLGPMLLLMHYIPTTPYLMDVQLVDGGGMDGNETTSRQPAPVTLHYCSPQKAFND